MKDQAYSDDPKHEPLIPTRPCKRLTHRRISEVGWNERAKLRGVSIRRTDFTRLPSNTRQNANILPRAHRHALLHTTSRAFGMDDTVPPHVPAGRYQPRSQQSANYAFLNHSSATLPNNLPPAVDDKPLARQKRRRTRYALRLEFSSVLLLMCLAVRKIRLSWKRHIFATSSPTRPRDWSS